jgi:pSer/pThr/pTyr-binding forkhead associated (FHA) protein
MDPFLDACGATGPLMLSVESPGLPTVDTHAFEQPFVLIGHDPRCDLRLNHPEVSERHAYLQLVAGRLVCLDLGSRNGVYQGGRRGRLMDVDRDRPIRIGPFRIRLLAGTLEDTPTRPALHGGNGTTHDGVPNVIELSHRALRQSRCDLPPGLALVGSSADCPIRLVDPCVSNYHASLVHTGVGVWIVDLLGHDGVRVNGHAVSFARLDQGDSVELGHSVIRLASVPRTESRSPAAPVEPTPPPPLETVDATPAASEPSSPTALSLALSMASVSESAAAPDVEAGMLAARATSEGHDLGVEARRPIAQAAEIVERVLTPVVNQVGRMQQQMVEEFHQARESMFEMFATLHHEQSAFLNNELEQLRQLGHDLHVLQADLERQTRALTERLGLDPVSATATTVTTVTPSSLVTGSPARLGSAASAGTRPPAGATDLPPLFVSRPTTVPTGPVGLNSDASRDQRHDFPVVRGQAFDRMTALDGTGHAPGPRKRLECGTRKSVSDENMHAQLIDRIVRIQEDHQSRWQRLLALF